MIITSLKDTERCIQVAKSLGISIHSNKVRITPAIQNFTTRGRSSSLLLCQILTNKSYSLSANF